MEAPNWSNKSAVTTHEFVEILQNIPKDTQLPFIVLDVRTGLEICLSDLPKNNEKGGEIPKLNISVSSVTSGDQGVLQRIPKDKYVFCLCRSGGRSQSATHFLKQQGYKAINVNDGMIGIGGVWKKTKGCNIF